MGKLVDRTDTKYGRLRVMKLSPIRTSKGATQWECICDCGNSTVVPSNYLLSGRTKSCGCLRAGATAFSYVHGSCNRPEYSSFKGARARCTNTKDQDYPDYGGRGIKFLYSSFEEFIADVGTKPTDQHSIDRVDTNGNYEPGNCRWATKELQAINKRMMSNNTSGYRGVTVMKNKQYRAMIKSDGVNYYLGEFSTPEEAALAYDAKCLELRGAEAKLNFPPKKPSVTQRMVLQLAESA